jgi:hypothetical protein
LLVGQVVGLLLQEGLQGPLGEALCGSEGDLLHGVEVEVEVVLACASGDDFAPSSGEVAEFLEFVGGQLAAWHEVSCLGFETNRRNGLPHLNLTVPTTLCKPVPDLAWLEVRNRFVISEVVQAARRR